ncbi:MAG: S1 RNA-binding domain-containing protein [Candidatus Paceibacterota bacterium]
MNPSKKNSNVPPKPGDINYFAESDYRNRNTKFGIRREDRTRHMYVIGKTGMGKTTLLQNMAIQDIRNGNGLAFIDPHGEVADSLLDYVPKDRVKDVMYFAPFDLEHPISFNVMEDVGPDKRHLVADGLLSAFKKIWVDMWSGRMEYLLNNALLALLEYPDATILGVNRMFADEEYRKRVVANVSDVSVKAFWENEFAGYDQQFAAQAASAIQNKVGQFVSNPQVRNIVGQVKSSFDVRQLMDEKKIMLINLSKGQVGEDNARLIGSMLITKMYLAAMSRADTGGSDGGLASLPQFYFYVDEFQSFANESFAGILSEARKYKLNLTIAHQYIEQMTEDVRNAVFGNVGTMISFRVGAFDAEVLEKEFAPEFEAEDLVNLGFAQIYLKLMVNGVSSKPFSARTLPPIDFRGKSYREEVREWSRQHFGRPRDEVEAEVDKWHDSTYGIIDDELAEQMAKQQAEKRKAEGKEPFEEPPAPKAELVKKYEVGQVIEGPIAGIADFGVFVTIENGLEGLVHVSEMDEGHVDDVHEFFEEGQEVSAKIIDIDAERVSLSIKALNEAELSDSETKSRSSGEQSDDSGEDDVDAEPKDTPAPEPPKPEKEPEVGSSDSESKSRPSRESTTDEGDEEKDEKKAAEIDTTKEPKLIKKKTSAKKDNPKTTDDNPALRKATQNKEESKDPKENDVELSNSETKSRSSGDKSPSTANKSKLQQALAKVKSSLGSSASEDKENESEDKAEPNESKTKSRISEADDGLPADFSEEELRQMLSVDQDISEAESSEDDEVPSEVDKSRSSGEQSDDSDDSGD